MEHSKILLVDDIPANITAMENILKPLNASIMRAYSGEEALKLLIRHTFAVIVLDVQMPGMDGFETAELIRQSGNGEYTPIIFATANDREQSRVTEGYGTGAVDYLFKPIDPIQLKAKVQVFLELDEQKNALRESLHKREELLGTIGKQNTRLKAQSKLWLAVACLMVISVGFIVYNFRVSRKNIRLEELNEQVAQLNRSYRRFVPHEFVALLNKKSINDIMLGAQVLKSMPVMFFDLYGFTSMTEQMSAEESINLMNEVFHTLQPSIAKHYGIINKYLGDGAMIIFPTGEVDAVQAAFAMVNSISRLNIKRTKHGLKPLKIGVGIDSGPVILGIVGDTNRLEYTAYGNTVNLASRVEGLTRQYGVDLLITENVYSRLDSQMQQNVRIVDNVRVKGKLGIITVYEAIGGDVTTISTRRKSLKNYLAGFHLYQKGEFRKAIAAFKRVLQIDQSDSLAKHHMVRCQNLIHTKLTDWKPIETFTTK